MSAHSHITDTHQAPDLLARYVRLLRFVWLSPSCAEGQAAMHAFERTHPELVENLHRQQIGKPLCNEDEIAWAIQNLNHFAKVCPDRWQRVTSTAAEVRELLGGG